MSAATVSAAIGDDGIEIAAQTLKQVAAQETLAPEIRVEAATTLLQYGLAYVDDYGNAARG